MNKNASKCTMVKFALTDKIDESLNALADEYFEVAAINYLEDGKEQLVGYKTMFAPDDLKNAANAWSIELPEYEIQILEEKDWLAENVIKFAPFEVGNFLIYGSHEKS